ncbi:protein tyrosine phosphatase [Paraburkholderia ginsengiterrae]|uniref:protein-tyrosine-phosphatase n=1 Tax=Paraburkholderia ginsengiterrae TaxID=1462993 RepID=A0A1A9N2R9_9BURK|nr:low molecular weight protein-tyrosine-phosphatase [Paraburkholderia ginsengiterrae]OAJ53137.1 protein tyrosine phosphatase [Paraburkholderia ginsengiterrae]OAJ55836.1 protein tyrosine phosphatase [Paraburkholderia ginsengiterrae]
MTGILMVCEGNICRSPVARAFLEHALPSVLVSSAGTRALVGRHADPLAIQLAQERGMNISQHIARALSEEHVRAADVVLTMTASQRDQILSRFPSARGKVFRLGEHEQLDIVDPYRRHRVVFELAFAQIEHCIAQWRDDIARLAH